MTISPSTLWESMYQAYAGLMHVCIHSLVAVTSSDNLLVGCSEIDH